MILLDVLDDRLFCLVQMDTDSIYIAHAEENLEDCIRPEKKQYWESIRSQWMCSEESVSVPGMFKVRPENLAIETTTTTTTIYFHAGGV